MMNRVFYHSVWGVKPRQNGNLKYRRLFLEPLERRDLPSSMTPLPEALPELTDLVSNVVVEASMVPQAVGYVPNIPISGIPQGDSGGSAGGDGWNSLTIPGFEGVGNVYYLTLYGDSIGRIVWLYAMYYENQERIVPEPPQLESNRSDETQEAEGLFGTQLAQTVYYDEYPDSPKPVKPEIIDENPKTPQPEHRIEHYLDSEMGKKLQELLERKKYFEEKHTPEEFVPQTPLFPPEVPIPQELPGDEPEEMEFPENSPEAPDEKLINLEEVNLTKEW